MKQHVIRLSLPEPCAVPWDKMMPVAERQRHCSSCDRVITDFSKMSDGELVDFLRKHKHACGQFAAHQLDRKLILPIAEQPRRRWSYAFVVATLLFVTDALAQRSQAKPRVEYPAADRANAPAPGKILNGAVRDSITGEAIPGVQVLVIHGRDTLRSMTDTTGNFTVTLKKTKFDSVRVKANCSGYVSAEKVFHPGETLLVMLPPVPPVVIADEKRMVIIEPDHVRGGIPVQRETVEEVPPPHPVRRFFYRLFHFWRKT